MSLIRQFSLEKISNNPLLPTNISIIYRKIHQIEIYVKEFVENSLLGTVQSLFYRVRWGNLGLNWAFFETDGVSSQSRWKY